MRCGTPLCGALWLHGRCDIFSFVLPAVDGAHLILPVLGKISFDAERMMVGKEMEIKMLGKPALLVVETSNDGSSLQFVLDGPAPLSGLVAGRPDMLNSPIGKVCFVPLPSFLVSSSLA